MPSRRVARQLLTERAPPACAIQDRNVDHAGKCRRTAASALFVQASVWTNTTRDSGEAPSAAPSKGRCCQSSRVASRRGCVVVHGPNQKSPVGPHLACCCCGAGVGPAEQITRGREGRALACNTSAPPQRRNNGRRKSGMAIAAARRGRRPTLHRYRMSATRARAASSQNGLRRRRQRVHRDLDPHARLPFAISPDIV
jgi:hypothetical protein